MPAKPIPMCPDGRGRKPNDDEPEGGPYVSAQQGRLVNQGRHAL